MIKSIKFFLCVLIIFNYFYGCSSQKTQKIELNKNELRLQTDTSINFADISYGKSLLSTNDKFLSTLSSFDMQSRMNLIDNEPTKDDFVKFISNQVLEWNSDEIDKISLCVIKISKQFKELNLKLTLPKEIIFIKTTGREEGHAAYTRGNAIILPQKKFKSSLTKLEVLIVHELFHIHTKNNLKSREDLHNILGFKKCKDITSVLPKHIDDYRITNPDSPQNNFYKYVKKSGNSIKVVPILVSHSDYKGGVFFKYISKELIVVDGVNSNMKIVYDEKAPILYRYEEVEGLYDKIGRDTKYNYHPEEVLASYFEFLYSERKGLKDEVIVKKMSLLFNF